MNEHLQQFVKKYNIKTNKHGMLILYKAVLESYGSWFMGKEGAYKPGNKVICREYSSDRSIDCGKGLHVGTLDMAKWFAKHVCWSDEYELNSGYRIIEVWVYPKDIVCVPFAVFEYCIIGENAKIRCKELYVAKEILHMPMKIKIQNPYIFTF